MHPSVNFAYAFLAGLLSFLSPCVLPLVPGYISMLSGTAGIATEEVGEEAAGLLLERIEHPDAPRRQIVLPPQLMIRESSGARRG